MKNSHHWCEKLVGHKISLLCSFTSLIYYTDIPMCDLCTKHGEGKIWYKNAINYSNDLLSDLERRRYIGNFLTTAFSEGFQTLGRL